MWRCIALVHDYAIYAIHSGLAAGSLSIGTQVRTSLYTNSLTCILLLSSTGRNTVETPRADTPVVPYDWLAKEPSASDRVTDALLPACCCLGAWMPYLHCLDNQPNIYMRIPLVPAIHSSQPSEDPSTVRPTPTYTSVEIKSGKNASPMRTPSEPVIGSRCAAWECSAAAV